jgi:serine phosphatase RsbU (regulator of sigma subunit)
MATEPDQRGQALAAFAGAGERLAHGAGLGEVVEAIAEALGRAAGADVVVARVLDAERMSLVARSVVASSPAVAAELEGTRLPLAELPDDEVDSLEHVGPLLARAARAAGSAAVLQVPVVVGGEPVGSLELLAATEPIGEAQRALARLAASQLGLAIRAFGPNGAALPGRLESADALALAGEALAAGSDEGRAGEHVTKLATDAAGAVCGLLWRRQDDGPPLLVAAHGVPPDADLDHAAALAAEALGDRSPVRIERADGLPAGTVLAATLQLGQPLLGALQLLYAERSAPSERELARLATFGVRAAHALRESARTRSLALELERARALLEVVAQASESLSLTRTLETVVEHVSELFGADRVAVYLREDHRLVAAAGRGLAGPHPRIAERLLDLALGPFRGRGVLVIEDAAADPRLLSVAEAVAESAIEAAVAAPLLVQQDVVGLLAFYGPAGRRLSEHENALLGALAAQLAVAVQNARLHEQTSELSTEREQALAAERDVSRRLRALYEISRSFAQTLSLETTLEALASTIVDLLDVDAAVIRMPDVRREQLVARAVHVADDRLGPAIPAILSRSQQLEKLPGRRLFRMGRPLVLDAASAARLGASYELLVPFLEKGSTAAVIPIRTPSELLATLTILSLDPARPIGEDVLATAMSIAGQASLAIDNARLYQQQKDFADTMQRSLLPRTHPQLPGLELGDVYASSARVELGGDVYDYMALDDGRLAVVLGDVTGHGVDATADMAMAKFVFRSLAREHREPSDFLSAANEVVVGEIAAGKFITMLYLTIDAERGEVACASAGHPAPRLVEPDGSVTPLDVRGMALGIEPTQLYDEVRRPLAPGAAVVLYTDGVVEARHGGELYGHDRLDSLLAERRDLPAGQLAAAVLADCRAFAGGQLVDDCAVVVIKHTE